MIWLNRTKFDYVQFYEAKNFVAFKSLKISLNYFFYGGRARNTKRREKKMLFLFVLDVDGNRIIIVSNFGYLLTLVFFEPFLLSLPHFATGKIIQQGKNSHVSEYLPPALLLFFCCFVSWHWNFNSLTCVASALLMTTFMFA